MARTYLSDEQVFLRFCRNMPMAAKYEGCNWAKNEIARLRRKVKRLERFTEILRTLLDERASMEEFQRAVKEVTK